MDATPTAAASARVARRRARSYAAAAAAGTGVGGGNLAENGVKRDEIRQEIGKAILDPESIPALKQKSRLGRKVVKERR